MLYIPFMQTLHKSCSDRQTNSHQCSLGTRRIHSMLTLSNSPAYATKKTPKRRYRTVAILLLSVLRTNYVPLVAWHLYKISQKSVGLLCDPVAAVLGITTQRNST